MGVKIQPFEAGSYRSDFSLWGWMKSEVYKEKLNTRYQLVARIMNITLLPRGLKSALKSMVGFLNTCFAMFQFIEIIYITNKYNQYVICLSFIAFVRLFMCNIQTAVSSHTLKIGHMFISTYLLGIILSTTS
jgi:hypothetical protein